MALFKKEFKLWLRANLFIFMFFFFIWNSNEFLLALKFTEVIVSILFRESVTLMSEETRGLLSSSYYLNV